MAALSGAKWKTRWGLAMLVLVSLMSFPCRAHSARGGDVHAAQQSAGKVIYVDRSGTRTKGPTARTVVSKPGESRTVLVSRMGYSANEFRSVMVALHEGTPLLVTPTGKLTELPTIQDAPQETNAGGGTAPGRIRNNPPFQGSKEQLKRHMMRRAKQRAKAENRPILWARSKTSRLVMPDGEVIKIRLKNP